MTIWFTSDPHYGHKNIIKYSNRPYRSVDEMNEALVANWNEVVQDRDDVYMLGDLCMGRVQDNIKYLKRLKGNKFWIVGNHDKKSKAISEYRDLFGWIKEYYELKVYDEELRSRQKIVLFHYPIASWNGAHRGSWHVHGHCHANYPPGLPHVKDKGRVLDAGVDVHNYRPINYNQVKSIMKTKRFLGVDHHGD